MLQDILQVQDWMVKIDLKQVYYAVPVHPDSQELLSFLWNQTQYQLTCLPLWSVVCPMDFYKGDETDSGFPYLHRRHSGNDMGYFSLST